MDWWQQFAVLIVAHLHTIVQGQGLYDCPQPWVQSAERCYLFVRETHLHNDARLACERFGATLVSVNDQSENNFIITNLQIQDDNLEWYTSGKRDLNDQAGRFKWEDGAIIDTTQGAPGWLNEEAKLKPGDYIFYQYDNLLARWGYIRGTDLARPYICEILRIDAAKIVTDIREADYGLNIEDDRFIPRGPHFVVQPQKVFYDPNSNFKRVSLECVADGWPQPTYTWRKETNANKININPLTDDRFTVTNGRLTINNPGKNQDYGDYICTASNEFGTVISNAVQITFGELPRFPNDDRQTQVVNAYSHAVIDCKPPATAAQITFQWYKDDSLNFVRPEFKPYIFISNNGKLYFSSINNEDSGEYFCLVSTPDGQGQSSTANPIEVQTANFQEVEPVIMSGFPVIFPNSPARGDNVRVECFAYGTGDLQYDWSRTDGNAFPTQARKEDHGRVLVIPNIQLKDAGTYKCSVTRLSGATVEAEINVSPQATPYFDFPLKNKYVDRGGNVEWKCRGDGRPTPTYAWHKNGEPFDADSLSTTDRQRISWNGARDILKINNTDPDKDNGMYQCAATNLQGTNYTAAELRVLSFAPNFDKYPMTPETLGTLGGNVTIPCKPEAAPKGTKTWKKDGSTLSLSTSSTARVRMTLDGGLFITRLNVGLDEGLYTCTVKNNLGEASNSTKLLIFGAAQMNLPPQRLIAYIGEDVSKTHRNMSCEATYNTRMDIIYLWEHNGHVINFRRSSHMFYQGEGVYAGYLYFRAITYELAGIYRCIARSPTNEIAREADLIVYGPPGEPSGVLGTVLSATTVRLTWNRGSEHGEPTTGYIIEDFNEHDGEWVQSAEIDENGVTINDPDNKDNRQKAYTVQELNAWSTYIFRVRSRNSRGLSKPSLPSPKYTTLQTRPNVAPRNVTGGGGKVGALVINWEPLTLAEVHGPGIKYTVYWRTPGQTDSDWNKFTIQLPDDAKMGRYVITVGSNNFYSDYEIAVQAVNNKGEGPLSDVVTIKSAEEMPAAVPDGVKAEPYNATGIRVFWNPVADNRETVQGKLKGYLISYWRPGIEQEDHAERATILGQASSGIIFGLLPDTYYRLTVNIINGAGNGDKSQSAYQRTLKSAPINMPEELTVRRIRSDTIKLKWRGVSTGQNEEPLQGYMLRIWKQGETIHKARDINAGRQTHAEITGIPTDINHIWNLRVFGYSRGGVGKMSSPVLQFVMGCQTIEDNPDAEYLYLCNDQTATASGATYKISILAVMLAILGHFMTHYL